MSNCPSNMRCARRQISGSAPVPQTCVSLPSGRPGADVTFPSSFPPAMAYVPWQKWDELYDPCKALECGTLFPVLNKPFTGKGGRCR